MTTASKFLDNRTECDDCGNAMRTEHRQKESLCHCCLNGDTEEHQSDEGGDEGGDQADEDAIGEAMEGKIADQAEKLRQSLVEALQRDEGGDD